MDSTSPKEFTIKVLGLSTGHPLRVRIFCHDPLVQDDLILTMLQNAYHYLTAKLALFTEHVYLRTTSDNEHVYYKMKDLGYEWLEIRKHCDHPFVVIYSETDLRFHRQAQQFIRRTSVGQATQEPPALSGVATQQTGLLNPLAKKVSIRANSVITTKLERQETVKNKILVINNKDDDSGESTQSIEKKKEYLTRDKGTNQKVTDRSQPYVFSKGDDRSPFSFLAQHRLEVVLLSPVYLSANQLTDKFNHSEKRMVSDNLWTNYKKNADGELVLSNQAVLDAEKGVMKEVLGNRLSSMFGNGEGNTGLPIRVFKPFSLLEAIANLFCNFDYLHQAAQIADPLLKFKYVITYVCSSWVYGISPWKPFTPYLGETLQAKTADGTEIYLEHYAHKPFIESMYMVNKKSNFTVSATIETDSDESANSVVVRFKGIVTVSLAGLAFHFTLPAIANEGFSYNRRTLAVKENACFYCPSLRMKALLRFSQGSRANQTEGAVYRMDYAVPVPANGSHLEKTLFRTGKAEPREALLSTVHGCWYEQLLFDSTSFWDNSRPSYKLLMKKDVLPSDWRFREDILWLLYENPKLALQWKLKLEEAQREFRMRRAKYVGKNKRMTGR